jgi:hypothetical protein
MTTAAISLARALPPGGRLITLELDGGYIQTVGGEGLHGFALAVVL